MHLELLTQGNHIGHQEQIVGALLRAKYRVSKGYFEGNSGSRYLGCKKRISGAVKGARISLPGADDVKEYRAVH
jgi:hypothetical protein